MNKHRQTYSFLLRLWQTGSRKHPDWRVSIESAVSGEKLGFDSLSGFCSYLQELIGDTGISPHQQQNSNCNLETQLKTCSEV